MSEAKKEPKIETPFDKSWRIIYPFVVLVVTGFIYLFSMVMTQLFAPLFLALAGAGSEVAAQFWSIILFYASMILLVWGALKLLGTNFKAIGLKKPKWADLSYALAGFAAYFVLYVVVSVLAKWLFPGIDFEQKQQVGFEAAREFPQLLLVFLGLVVAPPIAEEILSRGFLYSGLRRGWPMWLATIITSILFAMVHLQFSNNAPLLWVAALDTFALSIVLVILREKTGSLSSPIMLHMIKNGLAFTLLFVIGVR